MPPAADRLRKLSPSQLFSSSGGHEHPPEPANLDREKLRFRKAICRSLPLIAHFFTTEIVTDDGYFLE